MDTNYDEVGGRKLKKYVKSKKRRKLKKHIKTTANGYHYIPQYNDSWYGFTFDGKYDIVNFKTFMKVLTPYFSVQRIT